MDLYFLNFKKVLVILSDPNMRLNILESLDAQDIDADIKFVDSYSRGAKLIHEEKHNPYDHIILKFGANNKKFKDFMDYLNSLKNKSNYILEYTQNGEIKLP